MTVLPAPGAGSTGAGSSGTGLLLRFVLRRDRLRLTVWVLALGLLTVYAAVALDTTYPTAVARQARATVLQNPAAVLLSGPGYGTAHYSLGAMIANELGLSVMVAAAIMSIQIVVRHTRAEEEAGRADLIRAAAVGHRAPMTAALLAVAMANAAVAAVVTIGLVGDGLAAVDALALAAGIAAVGLVFGAVAGVTAQLTEHARAASGTALAALAGAVLVRGVGDVLRTGGSALSWFSPIAWAQQTRAFVDLRWGPLLLPLALTGVLVGVAYRLGGARDVGAGLGRPRPGPAGASPLLSGPAGLAVRLQRAAIAWWSVALLLVGLVFGSLADQVAGLVTGNARLRAVFAATGPAGPVDQFLAVTALYLALAAGAFAVTSVLRLRGEEAAGHTEVLLAGPLARLRYLGGGIAVTAAASAALLVAAGLGTGVAAAVARSDPGLVPAQLGAQLAHLPAVLVEAGIAAALLGLAPRWTGLAWVVVAWTVLQGLFGALLDLPGWVQRSSPFGWTPAVPAEAYDVVPLTFLTLLAVTLGGSALAGFRRRDVPTT